MMGEGRPLFSLSRGAAFGRRTIRTRNECKRYALSQRRIVGLLEAPQGVFLRAGYSLSIQRLSALYGAHGASQRARANFILYHTEVS